MRKKICFFGNFGTANFGNEITLQTILHHVRLRYPAAKVACICPEPEALAATQNIETIPMSRRFVKPWRLRTGLAKLLRKVFIGLPSEVCRWPEGFKRLKGSEMLIIPGTGLLTDAWGLSGWGPYNLFRWSLFAKLRGCKILFVSVGAGPISTRLGRYFVKSALSMADFRSYRDDASMAYLKGIGFRTNGDRVYPDLVFSLPEVTTPNFEKPTHRRIVNLGLMTYDGMYGPEKPSNREYREYLEKLVVFAEWLLAQNYTIQLLIGDIHDRSASEQFKSLISKSLKGYDEERFIDEPAVSVEQLLRQIAAADIVVATRFHNVLLSLVLNKPVIAVSFHPKCASLMSDMGLAEHCHYIKNMDAGKLIEQFRRVERDSEKLKTVIQERVKRLRNAVEEQYELIFKAYA